MLFTDRFIEVPCEVISVKEADLLGESLAQRVKVKGKINPFEISLYREDIVNESETPNVVVELKSGLTVVVLMKFHQFENLLNKFN